MNRELVVHTRSHDYPIIIGKKLIETFDFSDYISGHQVLVVTNETVAPLYLSTLLAQLPQNKTVVTCQCRSFGAFDRTIQKPAKH